MAQHDRGGQTKGDFSDPVNRVVRAAISAAMAEDGRLYGDSPESGYHSESFVVRSDGVLRWPDGRPYRPVVQYRTKIWEPWSDRIRGLLSDWRDLPGAGGFIDVSETLRSAARGLRPATVTSGDRTEIRVEGGGVLRTRIDRLNYGLGRLEGNTIYEFQDRYAARLETLNEGQFAVACVLGQCAEAERALWGQADRALHDILDDARQAFLDVRDVECLRKNAPGSYSKELGILEAVLSGARVFVTGALGTTLGSLASGVKLLSEFVDDDEPAKRTVGGASAHAVHSSLQQALEDLTSSIRAGERAIRRCLETNLATMKDQRRLFDLSAPPFSSESSPRRVADGFDVDPTVMRKVGRRNCARVAESFEHAGHRVRRAHGSGPWRRPGFLDGPTGPYPQFAELVDRLVYVADNTAFEIERAGKVLALTADYFEDSDRGAADALRRLDRLAQNFDARAPSLPGHRHR